MNIERETNTDKLLELIPTFNRGSFHTLAYEKREKQKGLSDFRRVDVFKIHYAEYEKKAKVIAYREATGVGPCNPAVINEEPTDIFGVYLNPKTNKIKLRVPLNGCEVLESHCFIGDIEVSKEAYYKEYEARGYKIPKKSPSKTEVEFRSFVLDNILWLH